MRPIWWGSFNHFYGPAAWHSPYPILTASDNEDDIPASQCEVNLCNNSAVATFMPPVTQRHRRQHRERVMPYPLEKGRPSTIVSLSTLWSDTEWNATASKVHAFALFFFQVPKYIISCALVRWYFVMGWTGRRTRHVGGRAGFTRSGPPSCNINLESILVLLTDWRVWQDPSKGSLLITHRVFRDIMSKSRSIS